jgi:hypothetical protein
MLNNKSIPFENILKFNCLKFLTTNNNSVNNAKTKRAKKNIVKKRKYIQELLSKGPKNLVIKSDIYIVYIYILFLYVEYYKAFWIFFPSTIAKDLSHMEYKRRFTK